MRAKYPVVLKQDGDAILLNFPDVPEANSCVYSVNDIQKCGIECLTLSFEFYIEKDSPIPLPSKEAEYFIVLPEEIEVAGKWYQWNCGKWQSNDGHN